MANRHFTPALFSFLKELEANNNRNWWEENKTRYHDVVRDPALEFIIDFGERLAKISPHFTAEAKTVGGSLMRPYRDIRFSKDKTPYKTNVGIQFRHEAGKDIHAPGYYLHLAPGSCFTGVGLWHPETDVARAIRGAIHDDAEGWSAATKGKAFTDAWSIAPDDDEMLKRVPPGFDPNHPHADDLRMKTFMAGARLTQKEVTSAGFDEVLAARFQKAAGYTRFLCDALELPF